MAAPRAAVGPEALAAAQQQGRKRSREAEDLLEGQQPPRARHRRQQLPPQREASFDEESEKLAQFGALLGVPGLYMPALSCCLAGLAQCHADRFCVSDLSLSNGPSS